MSASVFLALGDVLGLLLHTEECAVIAAAVLLGIAFCAFWRLVGVTE